MGASPVAIMHNLLKNESEVKPNINSLNTLSFIMMKWNYGGWKKRKNSYVLLNETIFLHRTWLCIKGYPGLSVSQ
jgi:hypothetical protein